MEGSTPVTSSAPASAPVSTGTSSTPATTSSPASSPSPSSSPTPYGAVPKSAAQQIWDSIDAKAEGTSTPAETPDLETPAAAAAPEPSGDPAATAQTAQDAQNEANLPPRLRESLKAIQDPKVRQYLADSAYMRQTVSKTGLPFATIQQFISEAPQYLSKAPTLDVLNEMSNTAQSADAIANSFRLGTPEGYQDFTRTLVQADPTAFTSYMGFLFENADNVAQGLATHFGAEYAAQVQAQMDRFRDQGMRNVVARMRQDAQKGGDAEVLGEVADEIEKYLGLAERAQAQQSNRPDPRDLTIQSLRAEQQRVVAQQRESFKEGVTNQAGNAIDKTIRDLVSQKASGFSAVAQQEIHKAIGEAVYSQLLQNPEIVRRVNAIDAAGKWDRAHSEQLHNLYVNAANRLMGTIAAPIFRRMAELTGASLEARAKKVAAQVARRDTGSSGSLPSPSAQPLFKPGMSTKDVFDALDARAAQGG